MTHRGYEALISVGSNVAPSRWVPIALERLGKRFSVLAVSPAYRSEAVGGRGELPVFTNLAVRLLTDCPPRALRLACRHLEERCGRRRTADRFAPRTLDLDVVLHGDLVLEMGDWRLPDPSLLTEPFVLVPCADVWPDAAFPPDGRTLASLRDGLDASAVATLHRLPDGVFA